MARRIEFIAPVESMRGNLSGDQKLTYPTQDNSAWEAPDDKRSYATNYQPRYVGAKRASDGLKYFAVKVRSAVRNSAAQRQVQAVLAGTKLSVDALKANLEQGVPLLALYAYQKDTAKTIPEDLSFDKWLTQTVRYIIETKQGEFTLPGPYPSGASQIILGNAWVAGSVPASSKMVPAVATDMVVKFWKQLAANGMYFYVGNNIGVSIFDPTNPSESQFDFQDIVGATNTAVPNVLGLTISAVSGANYVKYGSLFLLSSDRVSYVQDGSFAQVNEKFYLTSVAPTA